jgi:hypothetical protein
MSNYWSAHGDILVHENRGTATFGWVLVIAGTLMIPFIASGWVAVAACLALWIVYGLQAMALVARVEFDRRSRTMRQRNALGLKWTDPLDGFASVQVVRATSARGNPQIRVKLKCGERSGHPGSADYLVAIYGRASDAGEKEAREWADRLAQFLHLPLQLDL